MKPSTTARETSSRLPTRASTFGSTYRAPGIEEVVIIPLHPRPRHWHRLQQPVDQRVAGDPLRLGVEVGEHAVPQHRVRERTNVVEADVIPAAGQRPRLRAEDEEL